MKQKYQILLLISFLILPLMNAQAGVISGDEYAQRRAEIAEAVGANSLVILFPNEDVTRNDDVTWPFRQNTHLYYLTGNVTQKTHLLMLVGGDETEEYLFVEAANPQFETWIGRLPTEEENIATSGVERIVPIARFEATINGALNGRSRGEDRSRFAHFSRSVIKGEATVWLDLGGFRNIDQDGSLSPEQAFAQKLRRQFPEIKIRNLAPLLSQMREVKSENEITVLRHAINATLAAHKAAMDAASGATTEAQIKAVIEATFVNEGACCWGFPSIVAMGSNGTILHYTANDAALEHDKMILVDIGAEKEYYTADVTRTFPLDGTFSKEQADIYQIVLDAQSAAFELTHVGVEQKTLTDKAIEVVGAGLLELGLITENTPEQVRLYFFHGLGHSIGLDVHDPYNSFENPFQAGFVFTIEPGVYVRKKDVVANPLFKGLSAEEQAGIIEKLDIYDGIAVRIEDDVLVTDGAPVWLSDGAPRTIADIEAYMAK